MFYDRKCIFMKQIVIVAYITHFPLMCMYNSHRIDKVSAVCMCPVGVGY